MLRLIMALLFRIVKVMDASPATWLETWAQAYDRASTPSSKDAEAYDKVIRKHGVLEPEDFREIGRWKDEAWTEARFHPNVASVAFDVWESLAQNPPTMPNPDELSEFLRNLANRTSKLQWANGQRVERRFGLSRATTLLHFLSGGEYPIYDSRVYEAVRKLDPDAKPKWDDAEYYAAEFVPWFRRLQSECGTQDTRIADKALFAYGSSVAMLKTY